LLTGCASSSSPPKQAAREMREGVRAATRKYWQEALFRFERAHTLDATNPQILNNLAVALESMGRYDEALTVYKDALKLVPHNTVIKKNYARFAEFYSSYARGVKPKKDDNALP
jgi:Flp pilus assembly protein TadD